MRKVTVNTSTSYNILIGGGLLKQAGEEIRKRIQPCKAAIITDSTVKELYETEVRGSLETAGFAVCTYVFPAGEASKRIGTLEGILEYLAGEEMTRQDIIVALGGGVVGDMAGFAAAVYQRGIRFVQIPTTFLAAIDSSVGGKTAIDLAAGKNLAGAFYQPHLVLCDTDTLQSLPEEVFADGIAEALKYGVIGSRPLFEKVASGDFRQELDEVVETCVSMKRDVVEEDEFDTGKRQLLNLGHTFGHAIEQKSHFSLTHGHAVAIGLHLIARAAEAKGMAQPGTAEEIRQALVKNHLPVETAFSAAEIAEGTLRDKKRRGGAISFVFPREIGSCQIRKIPVEEVQALAETAMKKEGGPL
ncbi:3-dehydroquinate synthase [Anaerotignum lactatifermentans]|uniref:3-dehydroquinate synthase n=1 Tax=Anaerotignum lactatifermentans TaxID=160404 RepID=A0ABS2G777_9FIRM|nr:3-dehydroquinate synthase [Anaerotignum lactatifermentans]MBM6828287.1 3-dehydroquinate synthase [Anaerotignum lactatifermentans]MBM6876550.1 3-dehydroquinate synthase [Anaerotignum lactatifermentans]MBM6949870.1 3-dehydroquinate synthase [Anaerotignum lactatifermentans]